MTLLCSVSSQQVVWEPRDWYWSVTVWHSLRGAAVTARHLLRSICVRSLAKPFFRTSAKQEGSSEARVHPEVFPCCAGFGVWRSLLKVGMLQAYMGSWASSLLAVSCGCVHEGNRRLQERWSQHVSSEMLENCRGTLWANEAVSFYISGKLAPLSFFLWNAAL